MLIPHPIESSSLAHLHWVADVHQSNRPIAAPDLRGEILNCTMLNNMVLMMFHSSPFFGKKQWTIRAISISPSVLRRNNKEHFNFILKVHYEETHRNVVYCFYTSVDSRSSIDLTNNIAAAILPVCGCGCRCIGVCIYLYIIYIPDESRVCVRASERACVRACV